MSNPINPSEAPQSILRLLLGEFLVEIAVHPRDAEERASSLAAVEQALNLLPAHVRVTSTRQDAPPQVFDGPLRVEYIGMPVAEAPAIRRKMVTGENNPDTYVG